MNLFILCLFFYRKLCQNLNGITALKQVTIDVLAPEHKDHERKALVSMPNSHLFSHLFMCAVELALKGALFSSPRLGSKRYGVGHK